MPSLAELTDQYPQQDNTLPVAQPYTGSNLGPLQGSNSGIVGNTTAIVSPPAPDTIIQPDPNSVGTTDTSSGSHIIDKLLGLGGQERYQLWPEKVIRDAIAAPHDIMQANPYPEGSEENSWFEDQRSKDMVPAALNMSALAGTGGLAGTGAEVGEALGAGPFLRPALKVGDKIYKAPIKDASNPLGFGAEHSDALPASMADDFYKKAMSGEDIDHYNFGFVNHKGQFLDREKALDYGIQQGLVDPQNGKYGVLTSTMLADSSKPGTAIESLAKTQPFYSALEHNVNAINQAKMTGDQWLGTLANKPGVKPEELDWTGVKDFLQSKGNQPVTKAELQEHLQNNKVELKEVNKGAPFEAPEIAAKREEFQNLNDKAEEIENKGGNLTHQEYERMNELLSELMKHPNPWLTKGSDTKYHSYQLPGGENYREKLLTLPEKKMQFSQQQLDKAAKDIHSAFKKDRNETWDSLTAAKKQKYYNDVKEAQKGLADKPDPIANYKSSHWDEPNILAHVRMNDRMIDGKKSLHLEEIQSDWHQQGRDRGYKNPALEKQAEDKLNKAGYPISGEDARHAMREGILTKEEAEAIASQSHIPNAPFKKSWHELALKRMIREAAEKGYDRLSWTPGEAQAARYDLSKSYEKITTIPMENGEKKWWPKSQGGSTGESFTTDANGKVIRAGRSYGDIVGKNVSDVVGKDIADKGLKEGEQVLSGLDLKVGGEGMKGFYDQIIPKALEKIGKEHGVKVKQGEMLTKGDRVKGDLKSGVIEPNKAPIHYIDIPQSLKDKALGKGFPLFSSTHIFTPVSHNPFQTKEKK